MSAALAAPTETPPAGALAAASKDAARDPPRPAAPAPRENYALREAVIAWDMLAKVASVCPSPDANPMDRLRDLESAAQARLKLSAKAMHARLDNEAPPVLMTPLQAMQVVANAGGCGSAALAQWRGRAAFVADTTRQVVAGQARADRVWPRDPALDGPLRVVVTGQQLDAGHVTVGVHIVNRTAGSPRVALVAPQLFVGLCTRVAVDGAPATQGYVPQAWMTIKPHGTAAVRLTLDAACAHQPRANVGGGLVVDDGKGPRYWRFLVRGVGPAPMAAAP